MEIVPGVGWSCGLVAVVKVGVEGVPVIMHGSIESLPGSRRKVHGVMLLTRDLCRADKDCMYVCET